MRRQRGLRRDLHLLWLKEPNGCGARGSELLGAGRGLEGRPGAESGLSGDRTGGGDGLAGRGSGCRTDTEPGASGEGPGWGQGEARAEGLRRRLLRPRAARRRGRTCRGLGRRRGLGLGGGAHGRREEAPQEERDSQHLDRHAARGEGPAAQPHRALGGRPARATPARTRARTHARTGRALPVPGCLRTKAPRTTSGAPAQSPPCSRPPAWQPVAIGRGHAHLPPDGGWGEGPGMRSGAELKGKPHSQGGGRWWPLEPVQQRQADSREPLPVADQQVIPKACSASPKPAACVVRRTKITRGSRQKE